jgi:hypothetical protein
MSPLGEDLLNVFIGLERVVNQRLSLEIFFLGSLVIILETLQLAVFRARSAAADEPAIRPATP